MSDLAERAALLMRAWSDGEASMVRQLLATYGIRCQIVSDFPRTVLPTFIDGVREFRILVSRTRLDEARTLLAEHRREGLRVIRGGKRDHEPTRQDPG